MTKHKILRRLMFLAGFISGVFVLLMLDHRLSYSDEFGKHPWNLGERFTFVNLSPNDSIRVTMVERPAFFPSERVFELHLQKQGENSIIIFASPNVGSPAGSERIIWNQSSSQFILVGRHFHLSGIDPKLLPPTLKLKTGEEVLLLYNIQTKKIYCSLELIPFRNCLPLPKHLSPDFLEEFSENNNL
jgi:hypothetical protein